MFLQKLFPRFFQNSSNSPNCLPKQLFFSLGILFWKACSLLGPLGDMRFLPCFCSRIIYGPLQGGARKGTQKTFKNWPRKQLFLHVFIDFLSFFEFFCDLKSPKKLINPMVLACFWPSKKGSQTYVQKGTPKRNPKVTTNDPKMVPEREPKS